MKMTPWVCQSLLVRRDKRDMLKDGWEFVSASSNGKLWELDRGFRKNHRITEVKIAACGKAIWFKTEPRP